MSLCVFLIIIYLLYPVVLYFIKLVFEFFGVYICDLKYYFLFDVIHLILLFFTFVAFAVVFLISDILYYIITINVLLLYGYSLFADKNEEDLILFFMFILMLITVFIL